MAHPRATIELYGVRVAIEAEDEDLLEHILAVLPHGYRRVEPHGADPRFALLRPGPWVLRLPSGEELVGSDDRRVALDVLDARMRALIAGRAPEKVFVHAGVVGHDGRAILLAGDSFSGKSTLTVELVRAGALYLSDEYAVLDDRGRAHPYARPVSLRDERMMGVDHPVASFGGRAGEDPLPVALVVLARYRPGARWEPETLSPGEGVLALLSHTIAAESRPAATLSALRAALEGSLTLRGERGEAAEMVGELLARVEG